MRYPLSISTALNGLQHIERGTFFFAVLHKACTGFTSLLFASLYPCMPLASMITCIRSSRGCTFLYVRVCSCGMAFQLPGRTLRGRGQGQQPKPRADLYTRRDCPGHPHEPRCCARGCHQDLRQVKPGTNVMLKQCPYSCLHLQVQQNSRNKIQWGKAGICHLLISNR